jgi:hypothetical protein
LLWTKDLGMEITALTASLIAFLPLLLKLGGKKAVEQASESALDTLGGAAWSKAQVVWEKLRPQIEANVGVKEAVADAANHPEDEDFQAALRVQLKKLLAGNEELLKSVEQILHEDIIDVTSGNKNVQTLTGNQNQVSGQMTGGKVIGNIAGMELTPEETIRRVIAFERFVERKRQLWASLTPAEQAENDKQFEELYKSLEASRK